MSFIDYKKWSILKNVDKDIIKNIKSLYIFGTNADQYIIITTDDTVYAFGSNSNGCLGLGHTTAVPKPTKIVELCDKQVTNIEFSSNYEFVMALTKSSAVFSWGRNDFRQLFNGNDRVQYKPVSVRNLFIVDVFFTDVKCGYDYTLALENNGSVIMWGMEHTDYSNPREIKYASIQMKIISIDSGLFHSLALTNSGEVYFWGDSTYQKRRQHISIKWSLVQNLSNVVITKIRCGPNHCLLLSADGDVYTFGENTFGQCGSSDTNTVRSNPEKFIPENSDDVFTDIGAVKYYNISVAMTVNGNCYVWGECGGQSLTKPFRLPYSRPQNIDVVIDFYSKNSATFKPILFEDNKHTIKTRKGSRVVKTDRMRKQFNRKEFSDVAFKIDKKYMYAYKPYLSMVCDHFRTMFSDNKWKESNENEIKIKDYSYEVYYAFLKYLYTNTVAIDSKHLFGLLDLANCYLEEELKQRCIALLKNHVTIDNYYHISVCAVKYNLKELKDYCNNFMVNNNNKSFGGKLLD